MRRMSISELAAEHLRTGLRSGRWGGILPGWPAWRRISMSAVKRRADHRRDPPLFFAEEFFAPLRLHVPEHVSLVSTACDASLAGCHPPIAHMRWNASPVIRRVVRWVAAVRKGKADRKTISIHTEFVPGGSIGPVWKG
jgi:hypothetical protein